MLLLQSVFQKRGKLVEFPFLLYPVSPAQGLSLVRPSRKNSVILLFLLHSTTSLTTLLTPDVCGVSTLQAIPQHLLNVLQFSSVLMLSI